MFFEYLLIELILINKLLGFLRLFFFFIVYVIEFRFVKLNIIGVIYIYNR